MNLQNVEQSREQDAVLLASILEGLEWIAQAVCLTGRFKPGPMNGQDLMENCRNCGCMKIMIMF